DPHSGARARASVLPPRAHPLVLLRRSHRGRRRNRDRGSARGQHGRLRALARAPARGAGRDPVPGARLAPGRGPAPHPLADRPPPRARTEGARGARERAPVDAHAGRARLRRHSGRAVALRRALAARAPREARGRGAGRARGRGLAARVNPAFPYSSPRLGPVSAASPIFCVVGLGVPVLIGFLLGERPTAWAWSGVALAVVAIPPLSWTDEARSSYPPAHVRRTVLIAILTGFVVGWFLVFLARIGPRAGLVPLVLARVVA